MPILPNNKLPGGIDTGTGGFPVGESNSLNTYDVGSDLDNSHSKAVWSPGQINVDNEVKDLSIGTKRTLASYLSDTTLGKSPSAPSPIGNTYPINHVNGSNPDTLKLKDEKGYPTQPDRDLNDHLYKFTPGKNLQSRSSAANNFKIKRGRQEGDQPDGNDLLKNISPIKPAASSIGGKFTPAMSSINLPSDNPVKQYYGTPGSVSNSVIYNRFNPEGNDYKTLSQPISSQQFAKKYTLGTSEAIRDMSYGRLAHVGSILSSRASTELNSNAPEYVPDQGSAALPGPAQLGISRVNRDELTAESVIRELTEDSIPEQSLISVGTQSWGSINNINDQFSGMSNFGMQLLALAMIVALTVVIAAMSILFSIGSSNAPFKKKDSLNRPLYGVNIVGTSPGGLGNITFYLWRMLGIDITNNPLNVCIPTGALSFFGIETGATTAAQMALKIAMSGQSAVSQSPGYYAIIGRMIGLSFLQIGDAFAALGPAFAASAFSGVSQLFNSLAAIKATRFIKILNIFARIGDKAIDDAKQEVGGTDAEFTDGFGKRFIGDIDKLSNTNSLKGRMTKVDDGISPLTLAWAAYRSPDLFVVPSGLNSVLNSPNAKKLGLLPAYNSSIPENVDGGGLKTKGHKVLLSNENRISTVTREEMEKSLEAEYVPFYIHDVRTNEIVSFHAFLASLSDGYTASYDTSEGIGRVEPIKIYKSTTRKVDFSFYVAATNKNDFDSMWLKINKLTTLLYPQFTEGRTISDDKNSIYMPFSQTIQASPLVRVRIGDLITSNYSQFNLARIFGYTYAGNKFDGEEMPKEPDNGPSQEDFEKKLAELRERPGTTFTTDIPLNKAIPSPIADTRQLARNAVVGQYIVQGLVLKVVRKDAEGGIVCKVKLATGLDREAFNLSDRRMRELIDRYQNINEPLLHIINAGYHYVLNDYDLIPTPSTENKLNEEASSKYSVSVKKFMNENAISRSFKSSGGKGLAGFIESMNFDWFDRVTWATDEGSGRKAPKMCKVTISFSPIHDITPGLDHMGSNRAPLYRIKSLI